jgi:valyl-tRNA synthetase
VEKETARLAKELDTLIKEVERAEKKLSNQNFVAKAPADVIEKERAKQKEYMDKQQAVKERLAYLESLV